jgi:hypothetical protein
MSQSDRHASASKPSQDGSGQREQEQRAAAMRRAIRLVAVSERLLTESVQLLRKSQAAREAVQWSEPHAAVLPTPEERAASPAESAQAVRDSVVAFARKAHSDGVRPETMLVDLKGVLRDVLADVVPSPDGNQLYDTVVQFAIDAYFSTTDETS